MSTSSLESYYPSIIRLLDVQAIGPYLVKRGVLSSHEYYDSYAGPLEKGETSNYKLSLKLANKCLKMPKEFYEALEESLIHTQHTNHQELLELLPDQITGKKKSLVHRAAQKVKKKVSIKQKSSNESADGPEISTDSDNTHGSKQAHEAVISQSELPEMETGNSYVPLSRPCSSLNLPPTSADDKLQQVRLIGSSNMPTAHDKRNSIGHSELSCSDATSPQPSPTFSPMHRRSGSLSTSSHSITAATIEQEKSGTETEELYQQSKVEVEMLKEKNKSQAESIEKLQSECNELRNQMKEFEQMKERSGLLQEMLEKTTEENQKLNQQVTLTKVEASRLNEKLAAKIESEEVFIAAKIKLEENLQTMQAQHENFTIQLESANSKLESKLEKINTLETQNKELHEQMNELKLKVSQQQTEQNTYQSELEKEQQKCDEMQCQMQQKDQKIKNLEGKMEVTLLNFKQLQESIGSSMKERENRLKSKRSAKNSNSSSTKACLINVYEIDCTKQDLIEIIEVHVEQIEALHLKIDMYKREIIKLRQQIKCVI